MAYRGEKEKSALVDRVAAAARSGATGQAAEHAENFVRAYFAHVSPDDILACDEEALLSSALSLLRLMGVRDPNTPLVRVFNPGPGEHGWMCEHTVVEIVNDDMPFLVDSVTAELNRNHLTVHLVIHPVVNVVRNQKGRLQRLSGSEAGDPAESVMHIEINEQTLPERLRDIEKGLLRVLADVRAAVEDWPDMRVKLAELVGELGARPPSLPQGEIEETISLLRWLDDRNFTFLGYREFQYSGDEGQTALSIVPGSGLGVLRTDEITVFEGMHDGAVLPDNIAAFLRSPSLLTVSKGSSRSTVHRAVHLDTVGMKTYDSKGRVSGERMFVGLYTSVVYNQSVREIPVLRHKVAHVIEKAGFSPVGHNGKALEHILETLPRDDLFQFSEQELFDTAMGVLHLQERQHVAMFARKDPFNRFVSCLIYIPRERFTTLLREQMQRIVEQGFGGRVTVYYTQVSNAALARLQFIVKMEPGTGFPLSEAAIEQMLVDAGRDWRDDLGHALAEAHGEGRGLDLFRDYADAFPAAYREQYSVDEAIRDVDKLEETFLSGGMSIDLYRPAGAPENEVRLKVYHADVQLALSDVLPILENIGFRVIDEVPNPITLEGRANTVWVHDFGLASRSGDAVRLRAIKEEFEQLFERVWTGEVEDDGFNRLVLSAGLGWRQIVILRAYCKYLRQAAIPFSQAYMEDTLAGNPAIARNLVTLFETEFDPDKREQASAKATQLREEVRIALDEVDNLDEDRILRRFLNVVDSTLRTNFYQLDADGHSKPFLSLKIDSRSVDELPLPSPMVEIFIYSPRVEAVHLRGGRVARGGIRWSDRREDFRTEILGLMKAQMTKNSVIVPVGAKGGFVVKRPPSDPGREAQQEEGIACYRIMISGLLDITDNLHTDGIMYPKRVVRRDGDDPYLVVAADKGTATFSDIANGVARDYGFWLDDAFASGGSAGYDHKKMGITARGAWESVKRHFREMGKNIQTTDFTCIGVGDMSGDVFGNGMLLSEHIRLIGAFNHQHIFVDPDPDSAASFDERKRLFGLARSSWSDYDAKLISKGGGVFERSAKSIKVSSAMRSAFELGPAESVTPSELIRAMLRAQVELLWFGGIGTYVRARGESHADAGDRVNDVVRITGDELRCQVIGEGANLGLTQRGRIEYALNKGRINTDFIDNSAGVGTSDHEVNIKILLGEALAAGDLTMAERDKLLARMTDELADHVLMDNYRQSMALTHAEAQSAALIDESGRLMRELERAGLLDRNVETLPNDEELSERKIAGVGLTRPELSVLLAYSKLSLYDEILASDVPDDPYLAQDIGLYFPGPVRERFADSIPQHRLRREISATYITNSLVNRAGPTFINELKDRSGRPAGEIVKAYLIARQMFGMRGLWADVEALDNEVEAAVQTKMDLDICRLVRRATLWVLEHEEAPLDVAATIRRYSPGITTLAANFDDYLSDGLRQGIADGAAVLTDRGVPESLGRRIASLDILFPACDIVRIAAGGAYSVDEVARVYYDIGARFGLDWLRTAAGAMGAESEWQAAALAAIVDDLYEQQSVLATKMVDAAGGPAAADAVVEAWAAANSSGIKRVEHVLSELRTANALDLAMLSVANREICALVAG